MGYKRVIRERLEALTGTHIFRNLPRGVDPFADIQTLLPRIKVATIFDVGANVGQSAKEFLDRFPAAQLYCFEPVDSTYLKLQDELRGRPNVRTFKLALGAQAGARQMVLEGSPEMFFLQPQDGEVTVEAGTAVEQVALQTVDGFCQGQGISHIDFLKIDTEGHDLDVLKGTEAMLARQDVDIVQVEAGMNPQNRRHVGFDLFIRFMEPRGYFLFGIYEQMHEWLTGAPNLRRTNPIFVSERVIKANTSA